MASFSVLYKFIFQAKNDAVLRRMAASAKKMSGSMHAAGGSTNRLTGALGQLGKITALAAKKTAAYGKSAQGASGATNALAAGSKRAAGGIGMIGKAADAASSALARMAAASKAAIAGAARAAAYNRGLVAMGPREAAARSRGLTAAPILAGRAADRKARSALLARGGKGGKSWFGGSGWGRAATAGFAGGRMSMYGGPGAIAGVGGALGLHSAMKRFADFQEAEIMARAIGGRLGNSPGDMNAMVAQARQLGASTIFEPQDVLQGQLLFLKAGRSAREAMTGLPHTLNLAAVAGIDVAKATETSLNLMAQGRIPAAKLGQTMDALTATFLNSKAELLSLAQAANYAVPELTMAGVPIEQQFAALGALAEGGQAGTRGARALRQIFTSMKKIPFDKNKAGLLKKFGVNLNKYFDKGRLKDFTGFIEAMGAANEKSGNSLFARLFPANAITGIQTLVAQVETMKRVMAAVPGFAGINDELSVKRFEGLTGSIKQMKAAWSEFGIAFGSSGPGKGIENIVRAFTGFLGEMSSALNVGLDAFFEQLFDPVMMMQRISQAALRGLVRPLAHGIMTGIQGALNAVTETLGAGRLGDWFREFVNFDGIMDHLDKSIDDMAKAISDRGEMITSRVMARKDDKVAKRFGAFSPAGYNDFYKKFRSEIVLADDPVASSAASGMPIPGRNPKRFNPPPPSLNPNRIPEAAAQRVQVESRVNVAPVTFQPATVQVTGRLEGLAGIAARIQGSGQVQANRGVASSEAGAVTSAPAP